MHPHIYLRIGNHKCPAKEKTGPLTNDATQGKKEEHGLRKVADGMGRGKTGAFRTIIDKKTNMLCYRSVLAGTYPYNILFDYLATDDIAHGCREHNAQ